MEYKVETKYGRGNSQALKIAADISAIDLPETESVLFDFTRYHLQSAGRALRHGHLYRTDHQG